MADTEWSLAGFLPWRLGHLCFCIDGDLLMICVQAGDLQRSGYAAKLATLAGMKHDGLTACMTTTHNFIAMLKPGDLVCIPSNNVVLQQAIAQSVV